MAESQSLAFVEKSQVAAYSRLQFLGVRNGSWQLGPHAINSWSHRAEGVPGQTGFMWQWQYGSRGWRGRGGQGAARVACMHMVHERPGESGCGCWLLLRTSRVHASAAAGCAATAGLRRRVIRVSLRRAIPKPPFAHLLPPRLIASASAAAHQP